MPKAADSDRLSRVVSLTFVCFVLFLYGFRCYSRHEDELVVAAPRATEDSITRQHPPRVLSELYGRYPHEPITQQPFSFESVISPDSHSPPFTSHVVISHLAEKLHWVAALGSDVHTHVVHRAQLPPPARGVPQTNITEWFHKKRRETDALLASNAPALSFMDLLEQVPEDSSAVDVTQLVQFPPSRTTVYTIDGHMRGGDCVGWVYWILQHYDALPPRVAFLRGHPTIDDSPPLDTGFEDKPSLRFFYLRRLLDSTALSFEFAHEMPPLSRRCLRPEGSMCCGFRNDVARLLDEIERPLGPPEALPTVAEKAEAARTHSFVPYVPSGCSNNTVFVSSAMPAQFVVSAERIRTLTYAQWEKVLRFLMSPVTPWQPQPRTKYTEPFAMHDNCEALRPMWHILFGEPPDHMKMQYIQRLPTLQVGRWRDWDGWMIRQSAVKLRRYDWKPPPRKFPFIRNASEGP